MTPEQTTALIEQCDRDAAVAYLDGIERHKNSGVRVLEVLDCECGSPHPLALAFARHRLAAERRGMERAALIAEARYQRDVDGNAAWWRGDNNAASLAIATAIRKEAVNLTKEQAHAD